MQKTNTKKMGTGAALVIAIMSFGAFAALASIVTKNQSQITPVSLADDSNDGGDQNKGDEQKNESAKKAEEKSQESVKKQAENSQESAKKQSERTREANKQENNNGGSEAVESPEAPEAPETPESPEAVETPEGDNNGMFKDENKTLTKLNEKLAEAEKHILEKQAEGADVTVALANLALAKAKVAQVGASFDANDLESAKELSKEIQKEAHFTEKDLEFAKDASESVREVTKKMAEVNRKIAVLESLGGDASVFKTQLVLLQSDFSALQASAVTSPDVISRVVTKAFERKAEQLKNLVEKSIFVLGGTKENGDLYADHEKDSRDLENDLNDVAEIEDGDSNGVSQELKKVVAEHKSASQEIKKSLEDINGRSGVARVILGPDFNALDSLNEQTTAMNTRADALVAASTQVTDPQIKQILVDRADALRSEIVKLQAYISAENNQFSILGKLLSFFR